MKKLAMNRYGGIDLEGYTEYLNNLAQVAKLGTTFDIESLKFGEKTYAPKQEVITTLDPELKIRKLDVLT